MNLQHRIHILSELKKYILSEDPGWEAIQQKAGLANSWFILPFVELSCNNIARHFLDEKNLNEWTSAYPGLGSPSRIKQVGLVMAGNIPLVGFHDFLCVYISGHRAIIKLSARDELLLTHLVQKMQEWDPQLKDQIQFAPMLKGADAYIATGSSNTSRYFEYYFSRFPSIIRRNRSSVAILDGSESRKALEHLADDVHMYFGLGCRNVTKIYVPKEYNFIPLLEAFRKYNYFVHHHKYKNNFDYNLSLLLLNHQYFMSNDSILLVENTQLFSPISQLHYEYYEDKSLVLDQLNRNDLQCLVGTGMTGFGSTQAPGLSDYADGVDTLQFLQDL